MALYTNATLYGALPAGFTDSGDVPEPGLTDVQLDETLRTLHANTLAVQGRTLTAGTGLTGGGDLSSNRSFALTGQALALHDLADNGFIARTGSGSVAARTITGTINQITVTDGDGVGANPVLSLPSALTVPGSLTVTTTLGVTGDATFSGLLKSSRTVTATSGAHYTNTTDGTGSTNLAYGALLETTIDPASASTAANTGLFLDTYVPSTNGNVSGALSGMYSRLRNFHTGGGTSYGFVSYNESHAAHTGNLYGYYGGARKYSATTTSFGLGLWGLFQNLAAGGTVNEAWGVFGSVYAQTGTMGEASGGRFGVYGPTAATTLTTAYGVYIQAATVSGGGTLTNNYGLYLADQSAVGSSISYNIYSVGATAKNAFLGYVLVGGATYDAGYILNVTGSVNVSAGVVATSFSGDGASVTNVNAATLGGTALAGLAVTARGLPAGGLTGYALTKVSGTDYDVTWTAAAGGSPGGATTEVQYNDAGAFAGNSAFTFTVASGLVSATEYGIGGTKVLHQPIASTNIGIGPSTLAAAVTGMANNVAIGFEALRSANGAAADSNVAIGTQAAYSLTTGSSNVAIGYGSLSGSAATTTLGNVQIGGFAGYHSKGSYNVGIGANALYGNSGGTSTGAYNVAVGDLSLFSFTSGGYNVALGYRPMLNATTAAYNVALGYLAMGTGIATGNGYNVAIGSEAGKALTTAYGSIAIGYQALAAVNVGELNTAIGYQAMSSAAGSGSTRYNLAIGYLAANALTGASNTVLGHSAARYATNVTNIVAIGYLAMGTGVATGIGNVAVGTTAMNNVTTAAYNVALGYGAMGTGIATGSGYNVAIGYEAGKALTSGTNNVAIGYQSGLVLTDSLRSTLIGGLAGTALGAGTFDNTAVGYGALKGVTTGVSNVGVGNNTAGFGNGSNLVAVGVSSLLRGQGDGNVAVGAYALVGTSSPAATGAYNVAIGYYASNGFSTGGYNVSVGYQTMLNATTAAYNVALGYLAMGSGIATGSGYNVAIGYEAGKAITGAVYSVAIGYRALTTAANTSYSVAIGYNAMAVATASTSSIAIGTNALLIQTTGHSNVAIGTSAGAAITNAQHNTIVGISAALNNNPSRGTYIGYQAGYRASTGNGENVGVGWNSYSGLASSGAVGYYNTAIGGASQAYIQGGYSNTSVGHSSLYSLTSGVGNVALGYQAGYSLTTNGTGVFIGYQAGYSETAANRLYIANSNTANPLIYGEFDTFLLRVNGKLEIADTFDIELLGAGEGVILKSPNGTIRKRAYLDDSGNLVLSAAL